MERKIGEIFNVDGVDLIVVEQRGCEGCFFNQSSGCLSISLGDEGRCSMARIDHKSIIFKQIDKQEETPIIPIPQRFSIADAVRNDALSKEFENTIEQLAKEEFVRRYWDMQNTSLAQAMNCSRHTVQRIRKKILKKNRDNG